ncbi:B3 domain-containing transcription factor VRN1-like [Cornus florida]|uniref:B3 domain-containing transcription factor VRN1-like n=1 Tax=Cornus florida TaxID=4283 RepID=UPI0028A1515D|nr:B3 domain-containing transcription factor VRN1-like [Cornus florida]
MASSSRWQIDESTRQSSFPAIGPQFFKIIHNGIAHDPKLKIPREFAKKYGKHLSSFVFLKVPTGAVWKVELVDSDGDIWLQNGWQEFKEYYSIRYGHLLVFRFDGNSRFHVLIFDMSATEIEYAVGADSIEVDDSVEILDDFPTCQTREKKKDVSPKFVDDFPTLRTSNTMPTREMITIGTCKTENATNWEASSLDFQSRGIQTNGMKLANSNANGDSIFLTRKIKKECTGDTVAKTRHMHTKVPERRQSITVDEKFRALQRAKAYKSDDPFIVKFMQPSYVDQNSLTIPLVFARQYFSDKQNIILRVSDGRTWSVKCSFGSLNAKFSSGWGSFVQDNNLKVGDVCVFQMIKGIEPSLEVIIF